MMYVLSFTLFGCSVLAFYFVIHILQRLELRYRENRLTMILCFSSGIWSLGFSGIIVQTKPEYAYYCRALGMIGVFAVLIAAVRLASHLAKEAAWLKYMIHGFSYLGIVLYFPLQQKDMVIYEMAEFGMTYTFKPGFWSTIYNVYSIVIAIYLMAAMIRLRIVATKKRERIMAGKILLGVMIVAFGMVFDTVFPLLGLPAIPGSSYGQFFGVAVMYEAVFFINRSKINVENMSGFIYYSLEMPILLYDSEQRLQLVNSAASTFLGIGEEDNIHLNKLFDVGEDIFNFEEGRRDVDAVCHRNNIYCSLAVNKIYDAYQDVIGYIVIVDDLSERMKTVAELEEAIRSADRANEAKSAFLANMSHEIRTPMHAIIGFSELVLKSEITPEVRGYMEDIRISSNNLLAIINDILDISKIESGKMELLPENYYTSGLVKDVSLIVAGQAERKGLEFHVEVAEDIPMQLYGDKVRLRGVLINILNNAIKYTKKGSVSFRASVRERTESTVFLEFSVEDTGIGIREEEIERLFQKFERLDRKVHYGVEGSGLGLSIANGYVRMMGGRIQVNSVYGEGSVFTVVVPQKIVDERPMNLSYLYQQETAEETEQFRVEGLSVLVVDDNKVNLRVAQGILNAYGMKVDVTDSGAAAIEMCAERNYPLVFMDQMMPQIDGVNAMKIIREQNPYYAPGGEGRIIVLTADAISGVRQKLLAEGFDEYIGKPFNIKQLEHVILQFVPEKYITRNTRRIQESRETEQEQQLLEELKAKLPQVDVELGVSRCGKNVKEYLQVLKISYEYGERNQRQLLEYQQNGKYSDYTIKVHSLKSTALNIGAVHVSELAKQQELAGKAGDNGYIDAHCNELLQEYGVLLASIEQVLSGYGLITIYEREETPEEQEQCEEYPDKDSIVRILRNILDCLEDFDFNKVFIMLEEANKCSWRQKEQTLFQAIGDAMEDLALDTVKELIEEYCGDAN